MRGHVTGCAHDVTIPKYACTCAQQVFLRFPGQFCKQNDHFAAAYFVSNICDTSLSTIFVNKSGILLRLLKMEEVFSTRDAVCEVGAFC